MNVTNSSSSSSVVDVFESGNPVLTLVMCSLYLVVGTLAIVINTFNAALFATSKELRAKYFFFIALDIGDLIDGMSYIFVGVGRGLLVLRNEFMIPITIHNCFYTKSWPIPLIMGTEIPALITIIMAIERIIAVKRPAWFHKHWNQSLKWKLLLVVVFIECLSIACAAVSALNDTEESADQHCAIITSTAIWYSTSHFTFVVLAYVISFASLLFIYVTHRKQHKQSMAEQTRNPKLMLYLVLTGLSIVLFSLPSIVMIGSVWKVFVTTDIVVSLTYSATGFSSIVNTIVFYVCQEDFRNRFKQFINRIRLGKLSATVHNDGDRNRLHAATSICGVGGTMSTKQPNANVMVTPVVVIG